MPPSGIMFQMQDRDMDIIYGILEDIKGNIWLSTENGLICLNPETSKTEIYNTYNGLGFNSYSENTCFRRNDGSLAFGGSLGFEIVDAGKLASGKTGSKIELTKFLLFNKEVAIGQKDSPLGKSISFSDQLDTQIFPVKLQCRLLSP